MKIKRAILSVCLFLTCCGCSTTHNVENAETNIDKSVLVTEGHDVVSPSHEYTLRMNIATQEGVRGFSAFVISNIENRVVYKSNDFFRLRDVTYLLWGDSNTFWVYSGDLGTFYWVKTNDSWEKKSYADNKDGIKVPDVLKQLRPKVFE